MKPPRRSGYHASDEDGDLWRHTAQSIQPLKKSKGRVHASADASAATAAMPKAEKAERREKTVKSETRAPPVAAVAPRSTGVHAKAPDLADFDRKSARKIRSGRTEIEARIDLHGMRQHEAHAALRSFVIGSYSRGLRFVLIITGKGRTTASGTLSGDDGERDRGVLKRNVPRWLDEADLRAMVVSFTTAAISHGGQGALYVHLRSKNKR